jgi:hypothetical protein
MPPNYELWRRRTTVKMSKPYKPGELPPKGYVLAQDQNGNRFWVHPDNVIGNGIPISVLTASQEKRLRSAYHTLKEHDTRPLSVWYHNFRCDMTPEREILVYEAIAEAYRSELRTRRAKGGGKAQERRLLYQALFAAMNNALSLDNVLANVPEVKALPNLARAFDTLKAAWLKRQDAWAALPF